MKRFRLGTGLGSALLLALSLGAAAPRASAQDPARSFKSVYGKLQAVDEQQNALVMMSDDGERLAWRFDAIVIEKAAEIEPGASVIVIYRQTRPNEKMVTAVAFPGTASTPTYVNTTGSRIVLRSGPKVEGTCGGPGGDPVQEITILEGGQAETMEACWCCAPAGKTCTTGNQTGLGKALLVQCFE